jgi:hypothetical protein
VFLACWPLFIAGCVGGTSSAAGTEGDSSGGAGGAGGSTSPVNSCTPQDCTNFDNDDPACGYPEPGQLGAGPSILGDSPEVLSGFLEGTQLFFIADAGANESMAVFSVDVTTGDRTFISGAIEDPANGTMTRGSGPAVLSARDLARGPDGLYLYNEPELIRVDEATGERTVVWSNVEDGCIVVGNKAQLRSELEFDSDGSLLMLGFGEAASILRIDLSTGSCTTVSLALPKGDANQVGSGPDFYDYRSLSLNLDSGKLYTSNFTNQSLIEIDLSTGDRIRKSSSSGSTGVGEGPATGTQSILAAQTVVYAARGSASSSEVVTKIDLATGDREAILPFNGPVSNVSEPWLYGEIDGCFYLGRGGRIYAFHAGSKNSNIVSY